MEHYNDDQNHIPCIGTFPEMLGRSNMPNSITAKNMNVLILIVL